MNLFLVVYVIMASASPNQDAGASGDLSPNVIRSVVMSHAPALHACYEAERSRHPDLRGEITVAWTIDKSGAVSNVSLLHSTMSNSNVDACVLHEISTWRFATGPANIAAYPFKFGTR